MTIEDARVFESPIVIFLEFRIARYLVVADSKSYAMTPGRINPRLYFISYSIFLAHGHFPEEVLVIPL
jgi:hypothetical protein